MTSLSVTVLITDMDLQEILMRCIVIGGSGFIGSAIVKKLILAGHTVFSMGLSKSNNNDSVDLDIKDRNDVFSKVTDVDVLFHIGGVLGTHELNDQCYEAAMANVVGTVNILDACRRNGINKIVYPAKPDIWFNAYTISKRASLDFMLLYGSNFGMDVRAVTLRNAYGPGQSTGPVRKIIPHMMTQVALGKPIQIYGSGFQPVDLIHIDDVADALISAAFLDKQDVDWPIDTGRTVRISVVDLALRIQKVARADTGIDFIPMRSGESEGEWLGPPTVQTVLGLADKSLEPFPLNDGLKQSYDYYHRIAIGDVNQ